MCIRDRLPDLSDIDCPVIALGGLEPDKTGLCRRAGFEGIAVLGYLWNNPDEAIERYIRLKTPFVLSIAGFDPSSGAGIGADLKTFEATGSYGLGVCSALTFQNEDTFTGVHWTAWEDIKKQCDLLLQKYNVEFLKIGLIESFEILDRLLDYLLDQDKRLKIIWDPIPVSYTHLDVYKRQPIYTASAPLSIAALPTTRSLAGDNNSTFCICSSFD